MKNIKQVYEKLADKAIRVGQAHIFNNWDRLGDDQRESLLHQATAIDFDLIRELVDNHIKNSGARRVPVRLEPIQPIPIARTEEERLQAQKMAELGEGLLRKGKVGAILVAGGQGTRLGFDGPKGMFPIAPITGKSLFQLHAEKILALGRRYQTRIPWYIMTSETNHEETRDFFRKNNFFGLPKSEVFLFVQNMMPALDEQGKLILDGPGHIFTSPDGHGGIFEALAKSKAIEDMQQRGLEQLFYFQVDNVLVKICDPVFLGYHLHNKAEMSAKVCAKRDPFEKVGVVAKIDDRLGVIEYSDLSDADKIATDANGNLLYNAGSIAIHALSLSFIEAIARSNIKLPWHVAHKKIAYLDDTGNVVEPEAPNGYKFEKFIFDALAYARRSVILEVDRRQVFSPVKNAEGVDSPASARKDMSIQFAEWLRAAGFTLPSQNNIGKDIHIEISPLYALDQAEFVSKIGGAVQIERSFYLG